MSSSAALSRTNGNKNRAAELMRMNRTTLVEKLRKRGMITPAAMREEEQLARAEARRAMLAARASKNPAAGASVRDNGAMMNAANHDLNDIMIDPNGGNGNNPNLIPDKGI